MSYSEKKFWNNIYYYIFGYILIVIISARLLSFNEISFGRFILQSLILYIGLLIGASIFDKFFNKPINYEQPPFKKTYRKLQDSTRPSRKGGEDTESTTT